ncbi:hypothetical protein [Anaerotignum sp.]
MNKVLIFMCIAMSLVCMMAAAMVLAYKTQGIVLAFAGAAVNHAVAAGLLMLFAVLFLMLAAKVALKMRKK